MQGMFVVTILAMIGGCYSQSTQKFQGSWSNNVDCPGDELSILRLEYENLQKENQKLKDENQQLMDANTNLNKSLEDVTQQKENLLKENQKLKDENQHLIDVNMNLNKSLEGCSQSSLTPTCNEESGRWISGGHRSNGTFKNILSKIQLRNQTNQMYRFYHNTFRMSVVRNQLWVSVYGNSTIQVLELNKANKIKEIITTNYTQYPESLRPDNNGNVFLCSTTGLHVLDQYGSYLYKVGGGYIIDIHVGCNVAYLYNSTNNNVVTIVYNKGVWVVNNTFLANSSTSSYWNTLLVIGETVYVCSYNSHTIQRYTLTGTYITQYGSFGTNTPGQLYYPLLCGVDSQESLLVCDLYNNRLQVLSSDGTWQVFVLQGITRPYDLITDGEGNVWVLYKMSYPHYKLARFLV